MPTFTFILTIHHHHGPLSLLRQRNTRRRKCGIKQLCLPCNDHPSVARELEVRRRGARVDLADELAGRVPDVDAVVATSVDVSLCVAVDAVGEAGGGVGKDFAVFKGAVFFYFEAVAVMDVR